MTPHLVRWERCLSVLCRIMLDFRLFLEAKHVA